MGMTPIFRHSKLGNRGFTLFEVIIALTLIGLIMGLVVGRLGDIQGRDMQRAANRLAATMRYLYDKSATEGLYIRLMLDLQEQTYWVEATGDPFLLASPDAFEKQAAKGKPPSDTSATEKATAEGLPPPLEPKQPVFSQVAEHLLKPTRLPESVFFKDVHVEHERSAVDGGQVSIAFFPNGSVEAAIINLRDEDDEVHASLAINPATGRVNVSDEYRRREE